MRKLLFLMFMLCGLCFSSAAWGQCTSTTNIGFQVPNIGALTGWGPCLNTDLTDLDTLLGGSQTLTAASATPSVASFYGTWITANTGAQAITNFTGGFAGQTIKIICGSGDTFTSLATGTHLSLAGNWSCSSSGSISLVLVGSVWTEVGRSGGSLNINGSAVSSPNLNSTSPVADAGFAAAPFKVSGSNAIAESPAQLFGGYTFFVSGGTVYARNNTTLTVDFSGTDAALVIRSAIANVATTCPPLIFKNGIYNLNSLVLSTDTVTNYAIGLPGNAGTNQACKWVLRGESPTAWTGELTDPIQTDGVIFYVTPTAVASVGTTALIAGLFSEPQVPSGFADVAPKNITIRFPDNQRGHEIAFDAYNADAVDYNDDLADFNEQYSTIIAPSANSLIGFTTAVSGQGNIQNFKNTFSVGYDTAYDIASEHATIDTVTAIYSRYAAKVGFNATHNIDHTMTWRNFMDQENLNGITLGPHMDQGSLLNISGLDIENHTTGTWTRVNNLVETNPCFTSGIITYTSFAFDYSSIWSSGGQCFSTFNSAAPTGIAASPAFDSFSRANNPVLAAGWNDIGVPNHRCNSTGGLTIVSNSATSASGLAGCIFIAQQSNADQFSKATVNTIDASGLDVVVRSTQTSVLTYYDYFCSSSGGRILRKRVAGAFTTLASTVSNCSVGDVMELDAIGTNLYAYYNGAIDLSASDSAVTTGFPGILVGAPTTDSFTNWSGGSLPMRDATRSLYSQPAVFPTLTLTNLPTSAPATHCTLWSNAGVINITTCP